MLRGLQVATVGNESIKEGNEISYVVHYALIACFCLSIVVCFFECGYRSICKYGCGREDPIDVDALIESLTEEERKAVVAAVIKNGSTTPGGHFFVIDTATTTATTTGLGRETSDNEPTSEPNKEEQDDIESQAIVVQTTVSEKKVDASSSRLEDDIEDIPQTSKSSTDTELEEGEEDARHDEESKQIMSPLENEHRKVPAGENDDADSGGALALAPSNAQEEDVDDDNASACSTSSDNNENVCPICLGSLDDEEDAVFSSKACSHRIHAKCILEWLNIKEHKDCPVCRAQVISQEEMVAQALLVVKARVDNRTSMEKFMAFVGNNI